jgi:endo-1,4-beta-D-glucanase Y
MSRCFVPDRLLMGRSVALLVASSMLGCSAAATGGGTGSGGSGAGTGGSSGIMTNPSTSYAQNSSTATFPYPQNHALPNCAFPAYNTDIVETAYQNWKAKFFDGTKVIRPENSNDTVSEGIAYGMLIGVFMDDQPMFDTLWTYAKAHPSPKGDGLMTFCIPAGGSSCSGNGSATDADEDMAYALLMASKQWSGGTYGSDAATMIGNIYTHEVSGNVLLAGDSFGSGGTNQLDPSYFAPSYYRVFARVDSGHNWMGVLDESYTILAAASGSHGLVPNWVTQSGTGTGAVDSTNGTSFGYDACRTPFRIGMDYCLSGESRAQTYANLITAFYSSKSNATSLAGISDGYTTAGDNPSGTLGDYGAGMAFTGPAGVAAMAAGNTTLRDISYLTLKSDSTGGAMKVSGTFTYFHASWGVLSLMAMSGNFWDMTQ